MTLQPQPSGASAITVSHRQPAQIDTSETAICDRQHGRSKLSNAVFSRPWPLTAQHL